MEAIRDKFTASRLEHGAQGSFFQKLACLSSVLSTPGKGKVLSIFNKL